MKSLTHTIADLIADRLTAAIGDGSSPLGAGVSDGDQASAEMPETRLLFHGPALEILEPAFEELLHRRAATTASAPPLLLRLNDVPPGSSNPAIGASGRCNETHLLDIRNVPGSQGYLALVPPGQHSIMSNSTTADEFGLDAASNRQDATFEVWWNDAFLQHLVDSALSWSDLTPAQVNEARLLIHDAARAADDAAADSAERIGPWRVVSRLYAAVTRPHGLTTQQAISLACGVPPTANGVLSAKIQSGVLERLAAALADGFRQGVEALQQDCDDEGERAHLEALLHHLRSTCDLPTRFDRAPAAFYLPDQGLGVSDPPAWWLSLTAERWSELLAEEPTSTEDLSLRCTNALLPPSKGMPSVVRDEVILALAARGTPEEPVQVTLDRKLPGVGGSASVSIAVGPSASHVESGLPSHTVPARYKASAVGHRPATAQVISLATWKPGIFVGARLAKKVSPPRRAAKAQVRQGIDWESSVSLAGAGRYELVVLTSPGVIVAEESHASGDDRGEAQAARQVLPVKQLSDGSFQIELEAEGSLQLDLKFSAPDESGRSVEQVCRVYLTCEEVAEVGCRSEYERLIKANRRTIDGGDSKAVVQLNRSARAASLQGWMLDPEWAGRSYLPLVLADDYADAWIQPIWGDQARSIISRGRFLHDPRPPVSAFQPPAGFVAAREQLASLIRSTDEQLGLVEGAPLGRWLGQDPAFASEIEAYLDYYIAWTKSEPDIACWIDVLSVHSLEPDGRTLGRVPDGILLSPLHPIRLAWHAKAQHAMQATVDAGFPCPAVSVLDPDTVPDILLLATNAPGGTERLPFVAVECNSDYWSVLWNGQRLGRMAKRASEAPFGDAFGVSVGGISSGFSASQVSRALGDVSNLLSAKPSVSVVVASSGGAADSFNEGLIAWSTKQFQDGGGPMGSYGAGSRQLDVYDTRRGSEQPDDATIANLSEDTQNNVRWFTRQPKGRVPDLGIIAQLDSSDAEAAPAGGRSPLGFAALLRHRVRRQLPGGTSAFLGETRQGRPPPPSGDVLADKIASAVALVENAPEQVLGVRFAPNVHAIQDMLEVRRTEFVALSSAAVDPACFLGGWLPGAYLWDYDLPSYSHRSGDTNGYYLLSKVKEADRDGLSKVLRRLPDCKELQPEQVDLILQEVARRGIPTVRGLAGDDTGATGDLGLFLAVRLLQDSFRVGNSPGSLLPVLMEAEGETQIGIVVPVDPFQSHLEELAQSLPAERRPPSLSRPDLLVVGLRLTGAGVDIHLTPVEVKCRQGTFPASHFVDALAQSKALSRLLAELAPSDGQPTAWMLAFQNLLLSMIGFGMRVYSQHEDVAGRGQRWSEFHEEIAATILGGLGSITIDPHGRLIVIDQSPISDCDDKDGDGFDETIVVGANDAGRIARGDAEAFYASVRAKVESWALMPTGVPQSPQYSTPWEGQATAASLISDPEFSTPEPDVVDASTADDAPPQTGGNTEPAASAAAVEPTPPPSNSDSDSNSGVVLNVGRRLQGFDGGDLSLNISDTRLNQLNMGVVGDLGTGKTQLLKSLILQITTSANNNRGISPRFLIFDYKRDYSSEDFVKATGARVVKPRDLPFNLFDIGPLADSPAPWLDRFRFFADVLDKIYSGVGPVQRDKLKGAVKGAYDAVGPDRAPTIYDVHSAYKAILAGKSDSPMAIIDDLVDMGIFTSDPERTLPFDEFFDGVVVVSLDLLGQDDRSKNMLVAVMLNMFYENMLRTPKRPFVGSDPQLRAIDSYLLVDEADNIMRYEFDVLRKLLLQGREFGTGVILASQYLRHFKVGATDYREPLLSWFVHKVPNVTAAELSALGLSANTAELAERVKKLGNHECLYKSFDEPGSIIRGQPFFELIQQLEPDTGESG